MRCSGRGAPVGLDHEQHALGAARGEGPAALVAAVEHGDDHAHDLGLKLAHAREDARVERVRVRELDIGLALHVVERVAWRRAAGGGRRHGLVMGPQNEQPRVRARTEGMIDAAECLAGEELGLLRFKEGEALLDLVRTAHRAPRVGERSERAPRLPHRT